jgi:hypothetical protein
MAITTNVRLIYSPARFASDAAARPIKTSNDALGTKFDAGASWAHHEEAHVDGAFAHHDGFGVGKNASVDVDAKIAGVEAGECSVHAALELVLRGARADRLPHSVSHEFANA